MKILLVVRVTSVQESVLCPQKRPIRNNSMERQGLSLVKPEQEDARNSSRKCLVIGCIVKTAHISSPAIIMDLSVDGASVKCSEDVNPGMEITLILKLPSQPAELSIQAGAIHVGRFLQGYNNFSAFGVRFKNLSPELRLMLNDTP